LLHLIVQEKNSEKHKTVKVNNTTRVALLRLNILILA